MGDQQLPTEFPDFVAKHDYFVRLKITEISGNRTKEKVVEESR